ncbi:MAG TPA: hypothetical protein PKY59_19170 [Pyrinomonadaceae bacterium]|nr:hypothetical protein [Pyrinomonadaceae bacterium]
MSKKTLTIEGITFPKFSKGSSKRNFRLMFYIAYKDADGKNKTVIVTKPASGQWQWKKSDKDFYFPEANDLGDSIELDTSVLRFADKGFKEEDYKITEIDGKLSSVTVQFVDVYDASPLDFFKQKILPQVLEELKKIGFNPIDLVPLPGVVTGIIKDKIKIEDLAGKVEDYLKEEGKDKLLHRVSAKYKKGDSLTASGEKEWEDDKTGTYAVTIGIEDSEE